MGQRKESLSNCEILKDGSRPKICAPLTPGDERPTEADSKEGSKTRLLVVKHEAKD